MSDLPPFHVRPAQPADAFLAALLLGATGEPHFHTTAQKLAERFAAPAHGYVVGETAGQVTGLGSLWLPEFHPDHAWVGLHLHPDHHAGAAALLDFLALQARAAGRSHLWASVREDYLPTWPDLPALGFREVHRTFGGGFHLSDGHLRDWQANTARLEAALTRQGHWLTPAAPFQQDTRLTDLYALTRHDKVTAPPTIDPAAESLPTENLPTENLTDEEALWNAAWLAWHGETLVGLALPERSRLGAWNAVLVVHPEHRRQGLATALLARVVRSLQAGGLPFLNVAGSKRDAAYLGVLRRLGANIEPDWIAWERGA